MIVSTVVFMAVIGIAEIMGFNPVAAMGAVNFVNLVLAFYIAMPITWLLTLYTDVGLIKVGSFFSFALVELAVSAAVFGVMYAIGFSYMWLVPVV